MARKPDVPCAACGKLLYRGRGSLTPGQMTCQPCRKQRGGGAWSKKWLKEAGVCRDCGTAIPARKWSCEPCAASRRKDVNRRKNTKRRGISPSRYAIQDIGEANGWRCHLCNKAVDHTLSGMHRDGPTVDHIIPVSHGGTDEPHNVALAHRACNIKRGNRGHVQLRLIG